MYPEHRKWRQRSLLAALLSALVVGASTTDGVQALTWEEPTVVAKDSYTWPGSIVTFGATGSLLAYSTRTGDEVWQSFVRRTVGGVTTTTPWYEEAQDAPNAPSLAARGNSVDAVWATEDADGLRMISYRRSVDAGATWSARQELTALWTYRSLPRVARNAGDKVAVVWSNGATGKVRIRVSIDDGATFRRPHTVAAEGYDPVVAVAGGSIMVVYGRIVDHRYHLYVRRSVNNGWTWSTPVRLASRAALPDIFAVGNTVMVGFTKTGPDYVAVRTSPDAGVTWHSAVPLSAPTGWAAADIIVSARASTWLAVYRQCVSDECSGGYALRYRQSIDDGVTWSPRETLPTTTTYNFPSGLAATDSGPLVVWNGYGGGTGDVVFLGTTAP